MANMAIKTAKEYFQYLKAYHQFLFVCFIPLIYYAVELLPDSFVFGLSNLTGYLTEAFLKALSFSTNYKEGYITVLNFKMGIILECTAIQFIAIYFAGVLIYPFHNIRYKILGLLTGSTIIIFLNILRISVIGIIGAYSQSLFEIVHVYFWQGFFAAVVFLIWLVWVNGFSILNKSLLRSIIFALVSSSGLTIIMSLLMPYYVGLLGLVSNIILSTISTSWDVTLKIVENYIIYEGQGKLFHYFISGDIFDSVIVFAIITVASNAHNLKLMAKHFAVGICILAFVHLIFILVFWNIFNFDEQVSLLKSAFPIMRGVSLIAPLLIFFLLKRFAFRGNGKS